MRTILKTIRTELLKGNELVLVTIIASSGATPRGAGARMLIGREGRICGTIGGGGIESRAEGIAAQVLERKCSRGQDFSLVKGDSQKLGMICGGDCHVYFQYLHPGDTEILALTERAEARFQQGADLWLVCDLASGGRLSLADREDTRIAHLLKRRPQRYQSQDMDLFIEQINSSSRVYIFGGGHVSQELVPLLAHVGFRCTVVEDRTEFADPGRFPGAEQVILGDFSRIGDYLTVGHGDYVCVMTRGHEFDTVIQAQVLPCRPCYCGVIGSRRKAEGVRRALQEDYGLSERELARITTPIGLPIQAETPAEIAVSIAAQMILHRAQGRTL